MRCYQPLSPPPSSSPPSSWRYQSPLLDFLTEKQIDPKRFLRWNNNGIGRHLTPSLLFTSVFSSSVFHRLLQTIIILFFFMLLIIIDSVETGSSPAKVVRSSLSLPIVSIDDRLFRRGRETHNAFIRRLLHSATVVGNRRKANETLVPIHHVPPPPSTTLPQPSSNRWPEKPKNFFDKNGGGAGGSNEWRGERISSSMVKHQNPPVFIRNRPTTETIVPTSQKPRLSTGAKIQKLLANSSNRKKHRPTMMTSTTTTTTSPPTTVRNVIINQLDWTPKTDSGKFGEKTKSIQIVVNVGEKPPASGGRRRTSPVVELPPIKSSRLNLTRLSMVSAMQDELVAMIKQEFDAKNARLNQTAKLKFHNHEDDRQDSGLVYRPAAYPVLPPPTTTDITTTVRHDINEFISNVTTERFLLPPYQLPPNWDGTTPITTTTAVTPRLITTHNRRVFLESSTSATPITITTSSFVNGNVFSPPFHSTRISTIRNVTPATPSVSFRNRTNQYTERGDWWFRSTTPMTTTTTSTGGYMESPEGEEEKSPPTPSGDLSYDETIMSRVDHHHHQQQHHFRHNRRSNSSIGNGTDQESIFQQDESKNSVEMIGQKNYRLTTERLAYVLIGSCCALSVICLIIVAMSVRFKDMCDEYRSWKQAERAALRWQFHQPRRYTRSGYLSPPTRHQQRLLPRYFRTSIDRGKLHPATASIQPPNNRTDRMLETILSASKLPPTESPPEIASGNHGCCHCMNCTSTWFFRGGNNTGKYGDWCCQEGYYRPPKRNRLPFGAGSTVNHLMEQQQRNGGAGGFMVKNSITTPKPKATLANRYFSDTTAAPDSSGTNNFHSSCDHHHHHHHRSPPMDDNDAVIVSAADHPDDSDDDNNGGGDCAGFQSTFGHSHLHHHHHGPTTTRVPLRTGRTVTNFGPQPPPPPPSLPLTKNGNKRSSSSNKRGWYYYFDLEPEDDAVKKIPDQRSIWIDSSKLVNELHRRHQAMEAKRKSSNQSSIDEHNRRKSNAKDQIITTVADTDERLI